MKIIKENCSLDVKLCEIAHLRLGSVRYKNEFFIMYNFYAILCSILRVFADFNFP